MADTRTRKGQLKVIPSRLNGREESYLPRAVHLYNLMPGDKKQLDQRQLKKAAKMWVWDNVDIRP